MLAGHRGGPVGRVGVDDDQLVEQARRRAAARSRSRIGPIVSAHSRAGRIAATVVVFAASRRSSGEGGAVVAALLEPARQLEVAGEAALGAPVGAGRGGDRDRAQAVDRDPGAGQPVLELLVLERRHPGHAAGPPVGARGDAEAGAGEVGVLGGAAGGGLAGAGGEVDLAAGEDAVGQRRRFVGVEVDLAADRLGAGRDRLELAGDPVGRDPRVGVGAGEQAVVAAERFEPRAADVHPRRPRRARRRARDRRSRAGPVAAKRSRAASTASAVPSSQPSRTTITS